MLTIWVVQIGICIARNTEQKPASKSENSSLFGLDFGMHKSGDFGTLDMAYSQFHARAVPKKAALQVENLHSSRF